MRLRLKTAYGVLASDSPPRADWLMCWAQDGPGAGPFKDLRMDMRCVRAPPGTGAGHRGRIPRVAEPIWGMGWRVFP